MAFLELIPILPARLCTGVYFDAVHAHLGARLPNSAAVDQQANNQQVFHLVASLLDAFDRPLVVSDRLGKVLFTNFHAQDRVNNQGLGSKPDFNLFMDILSHRPQGCPRQLEAGAAGTQHPD